MCIWWSFWQISRRKSLLQKFSVRQHQKVSNILGCHLFRNSTAMNSFQMRRYMLFLSRVTLFLLDKMSFKFEKKNLLICRGLIWIFQLLQRLFLTLKQQQQLISELILVWRVSWSSNSKYLKKNPTKIWKKNLLLLIHTYPKWNLASHLVALRRLWICRK